jgi:hypothetical protein
MSPALLNVSSEAVEDEVIEETFLIFYSNV